MISAKKPTLATLRKPQSEKRPPAEAEDTAARQAMEAEAEQAPPAPPPRFQPKAPNNIKEARVSEALVESLIFKHLLAAGQLTGRKLATALGLPPKPIIEMLAGYKTRQLVYHKDSTAMGDFEYALTDTGRQLARSYMDECTYIGVTPVTLEDYIVSVRSQSIGAERAQRENLERAFADLLIDDAMFEQLGPAINSARGLFLFGYPGNGKTSIAERITACFGGSVWIPHAIVTSGEIITFYDPENHVAMEQESTSPLKEQSIDNRWIEIRRPTIVVGGELTMDSLDLRHNPHTKITEPPLQLKSNTGTFVIDDFGRQRVSPIELLNRWIVPLEKRYDFLTMANGSKIKVPFDQLIIFSTNLEPKDLVDEAFLRRIPYKINVVDPTEQQFRRLFDIMAPIVGVEVDPAAVDTLIEKHYKAVNRPFRACHPRDLLLQVKNTSAYQGQPPVTTEESFDAACGTYFALL